MTEQDIIAGLNSIAAKYGYGKNGNEAFSNDEWNTIERAKEIIREYETQNKRFAERRAEVAEKAFLILWKECKEKLGWNIDCTMWYAKQAKKELAEGKKDDGSRRV